jgi:cytochrome c-type biogenesis protein CcmH
MTESFTFWGIALAMTGIALGFVLTRLLARAKPSGSASSAAANLDVYRRALADLDRDLAAGALADDEYRQSKSDLERRFLAEARDDHPLSRTAHAPVSAALALGIGLPAFAFALYALFGDPAAATRDAAAEPAFDVSAVGTPVAARAALVAHLERSPRDGRSWVLLARLDLDGDRFSDAAAAYAKAIAVSAKVARDATVWCEYADALGMAQGGSLAGKPREFIAHALTLEPTHGKALEMAGSAALEQGDPGAAAAYWRQLLAQLPAASPARRDLATAIARADQLAANSSPSMHSR